jgi:hypothetical protein
MAAENVVVRRKLYVDRSLWDDDDPFCGDKSGNLEHDSHSMNTRHIQSWHPLSRAREGQLYVARSLWDPWSRHGPGPGMAQAGCRHGPGWRIEHVALR